jgi:hypothetical protein
MSCAYIVRWVKNSESNLGYFTATNLVQMLANPSLKPIGISGQPVSEEVIIEFLPLLIEIEQFTDSRKKSDGLLEIELTPEYSIFLFDTLTNLNNYNTEKQLLPNWNSYVTLRDKFYSELGISFEVLPVKEIPIDNMTPSDVIKSILMELNS